MPHSYDYNPGAAKGYQDLSPRGRIILWAIMLFLVVPFCGFFAGMTVSGVVPPIGNLVAPLACNNGTLQNNSHIFTNGYSTSYSPSYDCTNSATGKSENVSTTIDYIGGGVVAVVGFIGLGFILILIGTIRLLTGRSFV
jgi:hypothetical protein